MCRLQLAPNRREATPLHFFQTFNIRVSIILRYILLAYILCLRQLSVRLRKRFTALKSQIIIINITIMLEITLITTVIILILILIIRFPSMAELVRTGIVRSDEAARIGDKPSHQIVIIITRPYAALRTVGLHWIVEMGLRSGT